MRKSTFSGVLVLGFIVLLQSCRYDNHLLTTPPVPDQTFSEEFDTVSASLAKGWQVVNASDPIGSNVWQQGGAVTPWFPAYSNSGTYVGFIGADYTSTSAQAGVISNWLLSPVVTMQNGDKIVFHTRGLLYAYLGDSTDFGNRLQVRISKANESTNVGYGDDPGDFTTALLDINAAYDYYNVSAPIPTAYPGKWTRFEATVFGLNGPVKGRFAFRYFVEGGGSNGLGSGVAIDQVTYTSVNHK